MAKAKQTPMTKDPTGGGLLTARFLMSTVLMVAGIAWITFYYVAVRPELGGEPGGPAFMGRLADWNYLIGFGAFFLGLIAAAHPSTPLGRGRGVVAGMLACFLLGLLWICTFYVISNDISVLPIFNDLGQKNLIVGITFMAVGFIFATKWE